MLYAPTVEVSTLIEGATVTERSRVAISLSTYRIRLAVKEMVPPEQ